VDRLVTRVDAVYQSEYVLARNSNIADLGHGDGLGMRPILRSIRATVTSDCLLLHRTQLTPVLTSATSVEKDLSTHIDREIKIDVSWYHGAPLIGTNALT
jgi:hypothetical protein